MCRRRSARKWTETPIHKVFSTSDVFAMLKQRAQTARLREAIKLAGLQLYDAFHKFDYDKNGFLSPSEVWGAFTYLKVEISALDVLSFVNVADTDRDGNVSFREFVDILSASVDEAADQEGGACSPGSGGTSPQPTPLPVSRSASGSGSSSGSVSVSISTLDSVHSEATPGSVYALVRSNSQTNRLLRRQPSITPVIPRGESELRELQQQLLWEEQQEEQEAGSHEKAEEDRIRKELEAEEEEKDRTQVKG